MSLLMLENTIRKVGRLYSVNVRRIDFSPHKMVIECSMPPKNLDIFGDYIITILSIFNSRSSMIINQVEMELV